MTNGDQVPGGGGGQRTYSEEDVMALMNEAARRGASEAVKSQKRTEDEDDTAVSVINPKVVKQLKDTVAVFTALKELSSNPLQKTIEETVGGMAASVVQSAFAPRGPAPKQDIVDKLLNSQFAYGLGSGLGQRAPELVETMGRTFGTDKAGQMMDNIIGKYGSGGSQSRQLNPVPSPGPSGQSSGPSSGPSSPSSAPEQKSDKQSEKELLLSLDPNNPEHVSAYAETQGGLPVDVARKMLMIHQDAFIEQLKRDGMNVDQISTQRGSHAQSGPYVQQPPPVQPPVQPVQPPVQPVQPPVQPVQPPVQPVQPVPPSPTNQDIPPTYPVSYPGSPIEQPSPQYPDDIEYTEYNDMIQPDQGPGPQSSQPPDHQPAPPNNVDGQQVEMMKTFATDIGKVMGEMLNKIENLNNTVFTLQSEMNDMKKQGPVQSPPVHREILPKVPRIAEYPPSMTGTPVSPITHIETPSLETQVIETPKVPRIAEYPPGMIGTPISPITHIETPSLETFEDQVIETPKVPRIAEYPPSMTGTPVSPITHIETPSLETFEDQVIETPKVELNIKRSEDFFEEDVIDISNFQQELEEESKLYAQRIQRQTPPPELVTQQVPPVAQPVSPVLPTLPMTQAVKSVSQQPTVQLVQPQPTQPNQPPARPEKEEVEKEKNIVKKEEVEKEEKLVDIPKTDIESRPKDTDIKDLKEIPIISDDKTGDKTSKDYNKFVAPIKKIGVHKKAEYRNIKPSFKKNDEEENKEDI